MYTVFAKDKFPEYYVPKTFEGYVADLEVDGKTVELALWDTASEEEYDRIRPLSYPDTDVLLLCFSMACPASLQKIEDKWKPEVENWCPKVPIVLAGTKTDMRIIETKEGQDMAKKIGAFAYHECSAKMKEGVKEVFENVTRAAMQKKQRGRKQCLVL